MFLGDELNGFNISELKPSFRAEFIGDSGVYFQNIACIKSYTESEIILGIKRGVLILSGENLFIKKYCQGDVFICGKISGFLIK